MKVSKILFFLLISIIASQISYAEEVLEAVDKQVDPSNETRPFSYIGGGISGYFDGSFGGEVGGGYAKDISFDNRMFVGLDYENLAGTQRIINGKWGQYFEVGDDSLPQIGYNLEYQQSFENAGESDEKLLGHLLANVVMRFDLGVSWARIF